MDTIDKRQLEPLLRRALAGDACAWNEFFRQIRKHLHAETRKVLGPGVEGLVEHSVVVQSTLRRAWERIGDIFPDGPRDGALGRFLAWITTIVRNRSKDELRRLIRERARTAGSAIEDVPGRPDADRPRKREQIAVEVAAALALLPEKKRQVVELFWFEGLSDAAIGQRLGCSPRAASVLRCRALHCSEPRNSAPCWRNSMTVDSELLQWGEPPVSKNEEALILLLDRFLELRARGEEIPPEPLLTDAPELAEEGKAILQAAMGLEQLVSSVLEHSSIQRELADPAGAETVAYVGDLLADNRNLPDHNPREYRVLRFLGEGTFSQVWLADHLRLQIPVALKTLRFQGSGADRALALSALENEARVLVQLQHPNVVRVYNLFQAGDEHYLVMQYVDGGSLEARLQKDGPLDWQRAARYVADVGEALLHVHAHGIVHRDVKLANILWDQKRDEALLTDFGLAARLAQGRQVAGTPLYMAPEAFAGHSSPAGDVYGLAASLCTLVTGRVPFPARTREELLEQINRGLPDPEPLFAGVPERLERIIRSGLAAQPERRPGLDVFVADLRGSLNCLLADSLIVPASPVELRLTVSRWEGGDTFVPVAQTHPQPRGITRNLTKVPPLPKRVGLRTGDRVRLEVVADQRGFVTVFNVGPTGQLNLLYPDSGSIALQIPVAARQPLHVTDVALTPPAGNERLFAVWSRVPLPLEQAVELARGGKENVSASYRATRNMERVQQSVQQLKREDWHAVVLELDHRT